MTPDWLWLLSRPLASDEHRARFWVRHLRLGVILTELAALIALVYGLTTAPTTSHLMVILAILVMLAAPGLLAVPMHRLSRGQYGALVFYAWSIASTALIATAVLLDGGASSPLTWLLVLTLSFAGLAYPPLGVAAMGALMVATYLGLVAVSPVSFARASVTSSVLVLFTFMIAWASSNQWDMSDQQSVLMQRLGTLADTDDLTTLLNRRAFAGRVRHELAKVAPDRPLSLCVIDLDGFKQVNDTRGHADGDELLREVGHALLDACRETDSVSRLGGDEFAVLLPATSARAAADRADQLRVQVLSVGGVHGVTASIGVTTTAALVSGDELMAWADRAMYEAKAGGRNRIGQHT